MIQALRPRSFALCLGICLYGIWVASPAIAQENADPQLTAPTQNLDHGHVGLNGTLWMQTSLEYGVATTQAYQSAADHLQDAIADKAGFACTEQFAAKVYLPPAVILDVDETVLSNAPFQARLQRAGRGFNSEMWDQWCGEAIAEPIPGAIEFIAKARSLGVSIFFVTNRSANVKEATLANLRSTLGYQVAPTQLLTKGEQEGWTSDKSSRRQVVCNEYRVIMLIGDDFNDFYGIGSASPQTRYQVGMQMSHRFGRQWFLIPNPIYGNWEQALYDYDYGKTEAQKTKLKVEALQTKDAN